MKYLLVLAIVFSFSACSIFQTEEKEEKIAKENEKVEEVYVFDEVSESEDKTNDIKDLEKELDNTLNKNQNDSNIETNAFGEPSLAEKDINLTEGTTFYLQLGAFSTLKNAEQFVSEIKSQVPFTLSIIYNSKSSLYTVRSSPYSTKGEVEQIRDDFWSKSLFKDAFIVSE